MCFSHTNQSRAYASFFRLSHTSTFSTCPNHPKARDQTTRNGAHAPEPAEIIQLDNPELACPASPLPSLGDHNKAACHRSPHHHLCLWPALYVPPAPHFVRCPLFLGTVSITNGFSMVVSLDLLASPYPNNKIYILKHPAPLSCFVLL